MPPIGFFASSSSSYATGSGALTFLTPRASRAYDVLHAVIVAPSASVILAPSGWTLLGTLIAGAPVSMTSYLYRHSVLEDEPAQHVFTLGAALNPEPLGLLLLERGVDAGAALVASAQTMISPTSVNHAAPSVNLGTYSDAVIGVYYAKDAAGTDAFTAPANTLQRGATVHGPGAAGGGSLAVIEYFKEAIGATGALVGVWGTAATGLAAQYAIKAELTQLAPSIEADVPGAIGLTAVGV